MTDTPAATKSVVKEPTGRERRRHHHLRDLIDEMLASVRVATNRDLFSAEDRQDAERQLAAIMARVQAEAVRVGEARPAS